MPDLFNESPISTTLGMTVVLLLAQGKQVGSVNRGAVWKYLWSEPLSGEGRLVQPLFSILPYSSFCKLA